MRAGIDKSPSRTDGSLAKAHKQRVKAVNIAARRQCTASCYAGT
jgi:hypothetical protein